ncbi:MAG: helix-turn-helix transcriptional regulator [Oscillospiraceae bacterium]|nr:helix-turn-helix transcriptional regulator [Oscillospiraceae bacterium]
MSEKNIQKVEKNTDKKEKIPQEFKDFFANRMECLVKEKGINARKMSKEKLGMSAEYITKITSGEMMPSVYGFFEICDAMEVSPAYFKKDHDKIIHNYGEVYGFMNVWQYMLAEEADEERLNTSLELQNKNKLIEELIETDLSENELREIIKFAQAMSKMRDGK